MLLALINAGTKRQSRLATQKYYQTVGENIVPFLPVHYYPKLGKRRYYTRLTDNLRTIKKAGAEILAIPPDLWPYIQSIHPNTTDGTKYRLSLLSQLLNEDLPGWQEAALAIPIHNSFMQQTALILAAETKRLHLFGAVEYDLRNTASMIYSETGLITPYSLNCPNYAELIINPPENNLLPNNNTIVWQKWPDSIKDTANNLFDLHCAEGFLLASLNKARYENWLRLPLPIQVRQMARYAAHCGYSPSFFSQVKKSASISSFFSK